MDVSFAIGAKNNTAPAFASVSKGLEGIGNSAKFATGLLGGLMGIGSALAFFEMGKSAIEAGDQLAKLNSKLGMSVEALSQYKYISKLSGVEFEGFANGVKHMERGISEAAAGTGAALPAFNRLGLNIQQLRAMKPDQQFEAIAQAMTNIKDPTDRTNLAMDIFGKTGTELLPMLEGGAAGLKAMRTEADQLGLTMSDAKAKSFEALQDSMERFTTAIGGSFKGIIAEFAPMLTTALDFATQVAVALKNGIGGAVAWIRGKFAEFGDSDVFKVLLDGFVWVRNKTVDVLDSIGNAFKFLGDVFNAVGGQIYDIFKSSIFNPAQSVFTAVVGWVNGAWSAFGEWIKQITQTDDALVGLAHFGLFAVVKGINIMSLAISGAQISWNAFGRDANFAVGKIANALMWVIEAAARNDEWLFQKTGLEYFKKSAEIERAHLDFLIDAEKAATGAAMEFNNRLDESITRGTKLNDEFEKVLESVAGFKTGSASLDFEWGKLLPKFDFAKNKTGDVKNNLEPLPKFGNAFAASLEPAVALSGEIADNLDHAERSMEGMSAATSTFAAQGKSSGISASQKDVADVNALLDKMFPGRNIQSPFMPRREPEVTLRDASGVINLTLNVNSATLDQKGVDTLARQMYSSLGRLKDRIP